jgi:hypothetical protein
MLLLKMNPEEMLKEMEPAYTTYNGIEERLYSDFSTGDYPIQIQEEVHSRYVEDFNGKKPLVIFLSIFIDGALMNSTHSRSAVPIVLTVLNDKKKNSTVIAFNVNGIHESSEMLEHELHKLGITAIGRKADLLKQTLRQLNWDLFYVLFGNFYNRQKLVKGYDVQIGLGRHSQFHRVHFVFANLIGDHPQIHHNTGIKNNACHVCFNKYPFDFVISNRRRDGTGNCSKEVVFRDPMAQYDCAQKNAAIKACSDRQTLQCVKLKRNS